MSMSNSIQEYPGIAVLLAGTRGKKRRTGALHVHTLNRLKCSEHAVTSGGPLN